LSRVIQAVVMDVDGVLTDGSIWIDETGRESKRISFADVMGVSIGRRAGLKFALVSGENDTMLDHIAARFAIEDVYRGCKDKASAVREYASRNGFELAEICFIGDDVNDAPAMSICGMSAAPRDGHPAAHGVASIVTERPGGAGSVREVIDGLVAGHGIASRQDT
jgi:3-deoxy-D-manno-octulosonate 8-phosphate phosphatase (KDO 8-P phosphatase)